MDFFKQIQKPATHEVVVVEKRPHGNKGIARSEETKQKLREIGLDRKYPEVWKEQFRKHFYKGKSMQYWAEKLGVADYVVINHYKKWGHLDRINREIPSNPMVQDKLITQWAEQLNYHRSTLLGYYLKHGNIDKHIANPRPKGHKQQGNSHGVCVTPFGEFGSAGEAGRYAKEHDLFPNALRKVSDRVKSNDWPGYYLK